MNPSPPKYILRFLRWFCREDFLEEIEGDLFELFEQQFKSSPRRANWMFLWRVLHYFRPEFLKPFSTHPIIHFDMFRHNLLISYRSFIRNKTSFLINLGGLSVGLSCALLIFLWVQDEWQMDKFHENDDQLYQVRQLYYNGGANDLMDSSPAPLAKALMEEVPEVELAISAQYDDSFFDGVVVYENEKRIRATPCFTDNGFFEMFSYPLIEGDKGQVLSERHNVAISEELAITLFGSTGEAIGKSIEWKKKMYEDLDFSDVFYVSGVFDNMSAHSSQDFDIVFTYDFYASLNEITMSWWNDAATTYVLLTPGASVETINAKIKDIVSARRDRESQPFMLKKYSSLYLYNNYINGMNAGGRIDYIWLFSVIAILILLIASINFMNLSTARASIRSKEVGIKKTLGSSRKQLIFQFVTESLLIAFLAFGVAVLFISAFLPQFNVITGKQLEFTPSLYSLGSMLGITLFTGLCSSIYPAFYLSGFAPVKVLKGKLKASFGELWVRKGLVVFQFTMSVILIASVIVIYQQMQFIHNRNLGLAKDNILTIKNEGELRDHIENFLAEVKTLPTVKNASNASTNIINNQSWTTGSNWEGKKEDVVISVFIINHDFLNTYGIRIKEGRDFSPEFGAENTRVILNEAAVKSIGYENPVGRTMTFWGQEVEIVGVTENFHFQSLYNEVKPCIFKAFKEGQNYGDIISVKIQTGKEKEAIAAIGEVYQKFNPDTPFEYGFVDQDFQHLYETENRTATLSKYFAGLAIFISCLGLFGLTTFTIERRTKEIGIRKILGASGWRITRLLSSDFMRMVLIAVVIALPVSYWIASRWLGNFAFRIELHAGYFALAGFGILLIALLTVGFQTLKAASINPAECLRDE